MTLGAAEQASQLRPPPAAAAGAEAGEQTEDGPRMSAAEWAAKYVDAEGRVDLWLRDGFNAPSRLPGGRDDLLPPGAPLGAAARRPGLENLAWAGQAKSTARTHKVRVTNHLTGEVRTVFIFSLPPL